MRVARLNRLAELAFACSWAAAVCVHATSAAEPIYRWVDEHGIVHYSDRAPPAAFDQDAVELPPPTSARDVEAARFRLELLKRRVERAQAQRADAQEQGRADQEAAAAARAEVAKQCKLVEEGLRTLGFARPVYIVGDDGKWSFLSDKERAAEIALLEKARDDYCR